MDGLVEGRIVHYVLEHPTNGVEYCAAIVSLVLIDSKTKNPTDEGYVHLHFLNVFGSPVLVEKAVPYSADAKPRTWHWIPKV